MPLHSHAMYDHLVGEVCETMGTRVVLRVNGIGYELKVPVNAANALPVGRQHTLHTILHVVDGMPTLLGFSTRSERDLAKRVLNVSGVGPTTALSLLSVHAPTDLVGILARGDVTALRKVKGIGQKTAERLCLELREVMQKLDLGADRSAATVELVPQSSADAIAALLTLGYSEKEAKEKVEKARTRNTTASTEELVRAVLQM